MYQSVKFYNCFQTNNNLFICIYSILSEPQLRDSIMKQAIIDGFAINNEIRARPFGGDRSKSLRDSHNSDRLLWDWQLTFKQTAEKIVFSMKYMEKWPIFQ